MLNASCQSHLRFMSSVVHGKNELGHDFAHIYTPERWQANIEEPLIEFAASVFCEPITLIRNSF